MNSPEDYRAHNKLQYRDNLEMFKEYGHEILKDHGSFVDIGCGDGSTTSKIVQKFLPQNYKELLGFDKCEEMIRFANTRYGSDRISFKVYNIVDTLPVDYLDRFDRAFSFFTLHWVQNQEQAFYNIYRLLTTGGSLLTMFLGSTPLFFEVYRILRASKRWNEWLLDAENFISPYHNCPTPESNVEKLLTKIGFTDVKVICKDKTFNYVDKEQFKMAVKAVNPYKIPEEKIEDYLNDFVQTAFEKGLLDDSFIMEYKLIVVCAKKK